MFNGMFEAKCLIAVSYMADIEGLYILGDTFLRTYVTSFNYTSEVITLGLNSNAPGRLSSSRSWQFWLLIGIATVCGLLLIYVIICCIVRKIKQKKTD